MRSTTLGEIAVWGSGGTPKRSVAEHFGDGTPWLSIADLNDGLVTSAKESLTPAGIANSSAKVVPSGTIFVAMYGSIGKLGIAGTEMATSQAIAFAKPEQDLVDTRFLFHYLLAQRPKLQGLGRGGTQMNIGQGDLKSWPILLPRLSAQRRIAAILDQADAIRAKRRQVLARLDSLTQAIFHDMFGSANINQVPLGNLVDFYSGGTPSKARPENWTGDVPWFSAKDIKAPDLWNSQDHVADGVTQTTNLKLLPADTIAMVVRGMILAHTVPVATLRTPATINQDLKALIPKNYIESDFLAAAIRACHSWILARVSTAAHGTKKLDSAVLQSIPVPDVKPSLQRLFGARVTRVASQRVAMQRALAAEDELFASLQSRAFRGEL